MGGGGGEARKRRGAARIVLGRMWDDSQLQLCIGAFITYPPPASRAEEHPGEGKEHHQHTTEAKAQANRVFGRGDQKQLNANDGHLQQVHERKGRVLPSRLEGPPASDV